MPTPFDNTLFYVIVHITRHLQRLSRHKTIPPAHNHSPHPNFTILLPPLPIHLRIFLKHPISSESSIQGPSGRILHRVKVHDFVRECCLVLTQAVIKVFEVEFFFACGKCHGDIGLGLEIEVPERCCVFCLFVKGRPWESTLPLVDAGYVLGELSDVGVGNHAADVVAH